MNDTEKLSSPSTREGNEPAAESPVNEKFRDLIELEAEIRRRLRSNQRFLDKFLDEDFVDDEADEADEESGDDEEEL
jgi:hypothetical protein